MIVFHIGRPGSGKSYEAAAFEVRQALKMGRMIVTNMPLNVEVYAEEFPEAEDLITFVHREADGPRPFSVLEHYERHDKWRGPDGKMGPLFLIDEASQALPGAGRGKVPEEVKFWYEEHRHTGAKVVLITQQLDYVVKSVRNLADQVHAFKNLRVLGAASFYIKRTYEGPYGPSPGKKPDRLEWRRYRPKWFRYYNSFTKGGGPVKEKVKPLWQRPQIYIGVPAILWWLATVFGFTASIPESDDQAAGQQQEAATVGGPSTAGTARPAPASDEVAELRQELELLNAKRELHQARLELEHVERSVCAYDGKAPEKASRGILATGEGESASSGCRLVPRPPPPPRHLLAGAHVSVSSFVQVAGGSSPAAEIVVRRGGQAARYWASSLRASGWRVLPVGPCEVAIAGPWTGTIDCQGVYIPG